jgi:pentapeptide MXKDX repeat protein
MMWDNEIGSAMMKACAEIEQAMRANGDVQRAAAVEQLADKIRGEKLAIAMCGHFSAGKSTLINTLAGAQLLPSSPIPTSANVVTIAYGEPGVWVTRVPDDAGAELEKVRVPLSELEQVSKDGQVVKHVTVTYPIPLLGDQIVLLDTPGIDSTDDAHRLATESALHLADVVFYVMDYNHVQSEINFAFAAQLKEWGKPLYLIVNQIDKHREAELAWSAYQRSVETAFAAWNLEPAGIVYLSLRQPHHAHSQMDALLGLMAELAQMRTELAYASVQASLRHVAAEHMLWLRGEDEAHTAREAKIVQRYVASLGDAAGLVNADAVNADAVNADAVSADAVSADAVNADAVNADAVSADAVNADAVRADAVRADAVSADAVRVEKRSDEGNRSDGTAWRAGLTRVDRDDRDGTSPVYAAQETAVAVDEVDYPQLLAGVRSAREKLEAQWMQRMEATQQTGLRRELDQLLDNANVTPAATRELAHSFLESEAPGFKVGLFKSAAKTAAERAHRLQRLQADLAAQAEANVLWHVLALLRKAAEAAGLSASEIEPELLAALDVPVDEALVVGQVKRSATVGSGAYTLVYSRALSDALKAAYRRQAVRWIDDVLVPRGRAAGEAAAVPVQARLAELGEAEHALEALVQQGTARGVRIAQLAGMLPPEQAAPRCPAPRTHAAQAVKSAAVGDVTGASAAARASGSGSGSGSRDSARTDAGANASVLTMPAPAAQRAASCGRAAGTAHGVATESAADWCAAESPATPHAGVPAAAAPSAPADALAPQRAAAQRLAAATQLIAPHAALASFARDLTALSTRLAHSRFTIALFGAFSAGKSTLANALLGAQILPSSPNPTTATVNRIMAPPPDASADAARHNTALIRMKSREGLFEDIAYSLALLGHDVQAMTEAQLLRTLNGLSLQHLPPNTRAYYSFLQAAKHGFEEHAPLLGQSILVDRDTYARFVTEESKSCFVQEITLYYDHPLTRQGIVLVDTPGADSVNARHTDVAFNYIKNADAILFVTYYNHAFSQADQQFLQQLGRLKDQFSLDKMFFLVNAADLAASPAELNDVLTYVAHNLARHEIKNPRLFPLSSLEALEGKLAHDQGRIDASGMQAFEQAFMQFAQVELGSLAVQAADRELRRLVRTVEHWKEDASADRATRATQYATLEHQIARVMAKLEHFSPAHVATPDAEQGSGTNEQLTQEISELLYYVLQRLQYKFGDFFNYAFNPSVLTQDGRDLKNMLWICWRELQRTLQVELAQELAATTLRLEHYISAQVQKLYSERTQDIIMELPGFVPRAQWDDVPIFPPVERPSFTAEELDRRWFTARFKNPRHFFEGGGKAAMRQDLERALQAPLREWLKGADTDWQLHYAAQWQEQVHALQFNIMEEMMDYQRFTFASLNATTQDLDLTKLGKLAADLAALCRVSE